MAVYDDDVTYVYDDDVTYVYDDARIATWQVIAMRWQGVKKKTGSEKKKTLYR